MINFLGYVFAGILICFAYSIGALATAVMFAGNDLDDSAFMLGVAFWPIGVVWFICWKAVSKWKS